MLPTNETSNFVHPIATGLRATVIGTIGILTISANCISISVLRLTKQIPYIARICLINLGAADLMVGLVACLPSIVPAIISEWPFGDVWCQISGISHGVSVTVSIWSISAVSLDRYVAIIYPLRYNQIVTVKRLMWLLLGMWTLAIATFFIPLPTKSNFIYYRYSEANCMCGLFWEYPWFCVITAIYIPILSGACLLFTTVKIIKSIKLIKNQVGPASLDGNSGVNKKDVKAVKLLIITTLAYFTCWGPYVVQVVFESFFKEIAIHPVLSFCTVWLANSNSFGNVVIYILIYSSFRRNAIMVMKEAGKGNCCPAELNDRADTFETSG
ncbi:DgyrCDS2495 [Dimorphilus gyrociliatus]|uniref:DgyrCDS2495 n=1 Tax=Dimorphilus gyrociliatus TaxID=2664684 RepID=A0A7I8VC96_9ANNE|nr:DgyrCDS2495 [Dimorphilus gyrociliatus]